MGLFVAALWAGWLSACDDGVPPLELVRNCKSDAQCVAADDRYDACLWVCEATVTYCRTRCETSEDCRGIGLPDDYVYCDTPRPGEGFCNWYGYGYEPDSCEQDVPPLAGEAPAADPATGGEDEPETGTAG